MAKYTQYQTTCPCGRTTTKSYARQHDGKCKTCFTGVAPVKRGRSYDDVAREGGYEDTMGVSPDCLESYRNGGD
jgi:hypothetical protein